MLLFTFRYYWRAAKGHRLRPWRSPYLRWRMETFFGNHAEQLTPREFFRQLWRERRRFSGFLRWAAEMEVRQHNPRPLVDPGQPAAWDDFRASR